MAHFGDYSDDFRWLRIGAADQKALPAGVLPARIDGPAEARQSLIDAGHALGACFIPLCKIPSHNGEPGTGGRRRTGDFCADLAGAAGLPRTLVGFHVDLQLPRNTCLTVLKSGSVRRAVSLDEPKVRDAFEAQQLARRDEFRGPDLAAVMREDKMTEGGR